MHPFWKDFCILGRMDEVKDGDFPYEERPRFLL
jgi:hypothetical protein